MSEVDEVVIDEPLEEAEKESRNIIISKLDFSNAPKPDFTLIKYGIAEILTGVAVVILGSLSSKFLRSPEYLAEQAIDSDEQSFTDTFPGLWTGAMLLINGVIGMFAKKFTSDLFYKINFSVSNVTNISAVTGMALSLLSGMATSKIVRTLHVLNGFMLAFAIFICTKHLTRSYYKVFPPKQRGSATVNYIPESSSKPLLVEGAESGSSNETVMNPVHDTESSNERTGKPEVKPEKKPQSAGTHQPHHCKCGRKITQADFGLPRNRAYAGLFWGRYGKALQPVKEEEPHEMLSPEEEGTILLPRITVARRSQIQSSELYRIAEKQRPIDLLVLDEEGTVDIRTVCLSHSDDECSVGTALIISPGESGERTGTPVLLLQNTSAGATSSKQKNKPSTSTVSAVNQDKYDALTTATVHVDVQDPNEKSK